MSSDIYTTPDLSKKVRYNRKEQEDDVQWEEREVDIYESADAIRDDPTDLQLNSRGLHTEEHPPAVHRRSFWTAAICLGVLCFLSLIGNILQLLYRPHAQKNPAVVNRRYFKAAAVTLGGMYLLILAGIIIRFTLEKDQLQANYNKLSKNYSELEGRFSDVAVNNSQLQSSYETLSKSHDKLQDEVKQLKDKIEGKWCPVRWKRFGCSCYFKSSQTKTWYESRKHCQNIGADLVVINNKEEQKFVTELNQNGESWIGLSQTWTDTGWTWQWVDGSPLTETFWASGQPQGSWYQYATCCNQQGQWTGTSRYYDSNNFICEKQISWIL